MSCLSNETQQPRDDSAYRQVAAPVISDNSQQLTYWLESLHARLTQMYKNNNCNIDRLYIYASIR